MSSFKWALTHPTTRGLNYPGIIGYGASNNQFSIKYLPASTFNVVLETNGSFEEQGGLGNGSYGKFESKKIIRFGSRDGAGPGSRREDVTGIRK